MSTGREEADEQRRKVFRRMHWFYVYLPPLLLVLVVVAVGALVAWFVRWGDTNFVQRWMLASLLILAAGGILYLIQRWLESRQ